MTSEEHRQLMDSVSVLETSHDREALERAAVALAASEAPEFLGRLYDFLHKSDALARLDDLSSPPWKTWHLSRVLGALERHPSQATADLCRRLTYEPDFLADNDRKIYLLPALAAVQPMSAQAVEVLREANAEGYYNLNIILLVKNGGPLALGLFEEMIRDSSVPEERRIDGEHAAILPFRTQLAVLQSVDRLLNDDLEYDVQLGAIETVFDYRSREWFGPVREPPEPPPWESASSEALQFVLILAGKLVARGGLPGPLLEAVESTAAAVRQILAVREA
jgi:hypothetical protein